MSPTTILIPVHAACTRGVERCFSMVYPGVVVVRVGLAGCVMPVSVSPARSVQARSVQVSLRL